MSTVTIHDFVDYPKLIDGEQIIAFNNMYCYVVEPYEQKGIALYIGFREDKIFIRFADWKSNEIDVRTDKSVADLLPKIPNVATLMKSAHINDICLYFSGGLLVDAMLAANKFMGPGMLRDVFGKMFKTQIVREVAVMDKAKVENSKGCILKPSRFRFTMIGNMPIPMYGLVNG